METKCILIFTFLMAYLFGCQGISQDRQDRNEINQIVEPWVTFLHPFSLKTQTIKKLLENFLKGISSTPHGTCWTHAKNSANLNNLKAIVDVNYDVQIYQTNRTGNSSSLYSSLTDKSVLLFTSIISINIISINSLVSFYLCIYCSRNQHSPFNKCKFAAN